MISLYSGTPGSGKSLHIARRIFHTLRRHRPVICNFNINLKKVERKKSKRNKLKFSYVENMYLTPDYLIDYSRTYFAGKFVKEDEILLVIDEAQILFNSRAWQQAGRDKWLSFFSQHRKYGFEVVFIAQFDGMIDKQIRTLIEYNYLHRKLSNFGIIGKIMSIFALGKVFGAVKVWYPLNEKVGSELFTATRKYYSLYDTYADFGVEKSLSANSGQA